jgi:hypothetical protein
MHLRRKSWRARLNFGNVLFLPALFAFTFSCQGQSSGETLVPDKMNAGDFRGWPTIRQEVGFVASSSNPVGSLMKDQLQVVEDGVLQPDIRVLGIDQPASICLLVDQSSSMKNSGKALVAVAKHIIASARPTDEFAIVAFDKSVSMEQDFTTDPGKLLAALDRVGFGGPSSFFDAVWASIDQLSKRPIERRKILVVLSDGDDNFSHISFADLLRKAQSPGSPLIDSLSPSPMESTGLHNLKVLSEKTGGWSFVPDKSNLGDKVAEIVGDIHSRYSLEYISGHSQRDGKRHKVEVRFVSATKTEPHFRQEYYAPSH